MLLWRCPPHVVAGVSCNLSRLTHTLEPTFLSCLKATINLDEARISPLEVPPDQQGKTKGKMGSAYPLHSSPFPALPRKGETLVGGRGRISSSSLRAALHGSQADPECGHAMPRGHQRSRRYSRQASSLSRVGSLE